MKTSLVTIALVAVAVAGCGEKATPAAHPATDANAGKAIAARDCKGCHGVDGKGAAPAIPNLAAQRTRYLYNSLKEYKRGKRTHAAPNSMTANLVEADLRNVAAYYASLPPIAAALAPEEKRASPYEAGKKLATACAKCHGEDGNSTTPGIPSLAGQQPHYLVAAIQEYHLGDRAKGVMRLDVRDSDRLDLENLSLYFRSQTPIKRNAAARGDATAGETASAVCGGCHGVQGASTDTTTPSLAGQDPEYLAIAIKSYRSTRRNWSMQRYVAGLNDQDIDNIVAYYASQMPRAADRLPASMQELVTKCDHCHDQDATETMAAPKLKGQDKEYLTMALRAYRDDKRERSTMHQISYPYNNAIIDSLASWYASQPAK
jgi:cytochrome c553